MLKTRFGNILFHKHNNQYICYDSTVQLILKEHLISEFNAGNLRLGNTTNYLDYNNGWIKKHFWRKGGVSFLGDSYMYLGLSRTRPIRELKNYIDFNHIIENLSNIRLNNIIELCRPVLAHVKTNTVYYSGDIILTKIEGNTLDKVLKNNHNELLWDNLAFCFKVLFDNGIFNFDMNLTNILWNETSGKLSFIDFDKLIIDYGNKNHEKNARQVLGKFEKSLSKHDLRNNVDWSKFLSYIYS